MRRTRTGNSPAFANSYDLERPMPKIAPAVSTSMVAPRLRTASMVQTWGAPMWTSCAVVVVVVMAILPLRPAAGRHRCVLIRRCRSRVEGVVDGLDGGCYG